MSAVSIAAAVDVVEAEEFEDLVTIAPSTATRASKAGVSRRAPRPALDDSREAPEPNSVAEFVPWIPVVVPLLGAAMAFNAYLIGWAVLLRP